MNPQLITLLVTLIQAGVQIMQQLNTAMALAQRLQAEQRDPTEAEWRELDAALNQARGELERAIAAKASTGEKT